MQLSDIACALHSEGPGFNSLAYFNWVLSVRFGLIYQTGLSMCLRAKGIIGLLFQHSSLLL